MVVVLECHKNAGEAMSCFGTFGHGELGHWRGPGQKEVEGKMEKTYRRLLLIKKLNQSIPLVSYA